MSAEQSSAKRGAEFVNLHGFGGGSRATGRCALPFRDNGCGGMNASDVRF